MDYREFEDKVLEILNNWLYNCKIVFYYNPIVFTYRCEIKYDIYNISYKCEIEYSPNLTAEYTAHYIISNLESYIIKRFICTRL